MRILQLLIALAATLLAVVIGPAGAQTSFWLATDAAGTPVPADTVYVAAGATVQLYCFVESDAVGNAFETMVGYDTSDADTYGVGVDTYNGASKKLTLVNGSAIAGTVPASFDVISSSPYASKAVSLDASGREPSNSSLGGRPYGFVVRAATSANEVPGELRCFSFTLQNNMTTDGDYQYAVVSYLSGGDSYSSAWKHGTTLNEASYALKVVTGVPRPVVGANNKSVLDAIMSDAAPDYDWVFWGRVSDRTDSGFKIDDGSGVIITVSTPSGNSVADGNYVAVKGTLNADTKVLTAQQITAYSE